MGLFNYRPGRVDSGSSDNESPLLGICPGNLFWTADRTTHKLANRDTSDAMAYRRKLDFRNVGILVIHARAVSLPRRSRRGADGNDMGFRKCTNRGRVCPDHAKSPDIRHTHCAEKICGTRRNVFSTNYERNSNNRDDRPRNMGFDFLAKPASSFIFYTRTFSQRDRIPSFGQSSSCRNLADVYLFACS